MEQFDAIGAAFDNTVVDMAADGDGAHGHCGIRQALCHCYHIGRNAQRFRRRCTADTSKARNDFIKDKKDAVFAGNLAQLFEIADGRNQDAG